MRRMTMEMEKKMARGTNDWAVSFHAQRRTSAQSFRAALEIHWLSIHHTFTTL